MENKLITQVKCKTCSKLLDKNMNEVRVGLEFVPLDGLCLMCFASVYISQNPYSIYGATQEIFTSLCPDFDKSGKDSDEMD